ncbi:RNA-binding protein Musashi homolog 2-like isoform X1 [Synchiropus splendidus]|uniref:RNA-binding protein Musashi homolog 2-like isoform X1 n=2 Tax=Synchiropus splendidus TaxID=270530 RepID=UPI00237E8AE1|nr:RNA-binding protein Musashi homolog 2-like isoform X1 [Synchiropus splendidus]XP_053728297.1 RNA-binding protein Musashi homolog 2-like isoform X1 [Synchiropus splendidus]
MELHGEQLTESQSETQHDPGKMFIGGLSWQTSPDSLRDYFNGFGEIRECMVMKDPSTKRSRGFGFVTFMDAATVDKVLAHPHHELDSKTIDPKVAFPRQAQHKVVTRTKKVFVGGLSASTDVDDVRLYFEQFGKVEDAMLLFDKSTHRHRGFGFVTFEIEDAVEKVCDIHFHEINNKMVECKKAQPKEVMYPTGAQGRASGLPFAVDALMLGMLSCPNFVSCGRSYAGFTQSYTYQLPGFHAAAYGPVAAAAVAAVRGSGLADYGTYSVAAASSDVRGGALYSLDCGSFRHQAQVLTSEPPSSTCNSPSSLQHHLPSPDAFKNPGTSLTRPGAYPCAESPAAELYSSSALDSSSYVGPSSMQHGASFSHSLSGPLIAAAYTHGFH